MQDAHDFNVFQHLRHLAAAEGAGDVLCAPLQVVGKDGVGIPFGDLVALDFFPHKLEIVAISRVLCRAIIMRFLSPDNAIRHSKRLVFAQAGIEGSGAKLVEGLHSPRFVLDGHGAVPSINKVEFDRTLVAGRLWDISARWKNILADIRQVRGNG